jgi:hypothetical protein
VTFVDLQERVGSRGGAVGLVGGGGEKRTGIGVFPLGQDLRGRAGFHDLALVHHRDAVGHAGDDGEVVGDEEKAHLLLGHEVLEQVEDLRLRGDVERGGGLIGDQEPRVQRDGRGDADALPLAAGQLMRDRRRGRYGTGRRGRGGRGRWRAPAAVGLAVDGERFGHLVADGLHRVERRHRFLEDHRDVVAAGGAPVGLGLVEEGLAVERMSPVAVAPSGRRPISASAVMDLPEPLSPTRPKTSPCAMSSETSAQDRGAVDGDAEAVDLDHGAHRIFV